MKLPTRMTSRTGSNNHLGFTFVEVMVTLVVLSAGIVFIYKTFFLCVDYLSRLSTRLCANELIDSRVSEISRLMREHGDLSFDRGPLIVTKEISHKRIDFNYQINFVPVTGYEGLYRLDVGLSWQDHGRSMHYMRSAVLTL